MEHGEQVHLLLSAPGQPPLTLPASPWRAWVPTERGPIDPVTAAASLRLSPVSHRAERSLVAAVANDDVDTLVRLAGQNGPIQEAAQVLAGLRLATVDPATAVDLLSALATAPQDPTANKVLRRHWSDLAVQVALAPSVPALVTLSRAGLALLAVDLLVDLGRLAEALTLLAAAPARSAVVLAHAATLLANGDHQRVLDVTASHPNVDDVSTLTLVARSVAARSLNDLPTALDAVCEALAVPARNGAVIVAALEERAHLYGLAGDTTAAHADLQALADLATGGEVTIPAPSALRRSDDVDGDDGLDRARNRMRRRITGVGEPGTFGGRHHSTYRDEIASMFDLGQIDAVEELLLGLLDAVEDELDEVGVPLDATFHLTLADLYQDSGRTEDLHALRERYAAAEARSRRANAAVAPDEPAAGATEPATTSSLPPDAFMARPVASAGEEPTATPAPVVAPVADPVVAVVPAPVAVAIDPAVVVAPPVPAPFVEPSARERLTEEATEPTPEPDVSLVEPPVEPLVEPPVERELTAVERAVRGPRVRSL